VPRPSKAEMEKVAAAAQAALARTDRMAFLSPQQKEVLRRRAAGETLTQMERDLGLTRKDVVALYDEALKIANG
jgi:transcriptional regulator